uniref:Alternative protein MYOG n=1 Tax=Homo sapiens TaxID=9606 RepID=L8E8X4_HUMAN|nr:alternative protein MYOG [Homo sapiens]
MLGSQLWGAIGQTIPFLIHVRLTHPPARDWTPSFSCLLRGEGIPFPGR